MMQEISVFATAALIMVVRAAAWGLVVGGLLSIPLLIRGRRAIPLVLATSFAVCLTMLPFPDPATFDCATTPARLVLQPFDGLGGVVRIIARTGEVWRLLTDLTFVSSVMNVVFFMLPGAALALLIRSGWGAAAYGLGLSLAIEITQFTGNFGWYDCAYRYADVTDLCTNTLGVWLGFVLATRYRRSRTAAPA